MIHAVFDIILASLYADVAFYFLNEHCFVKRNDHLTSKKTILELL